MNYNEIEELVLLKQEGSYWDFKRQWYQENKKEDLLHDIICMANNLSNKDAYIIIGIDEENDYSVFSVKNDANRKNTQQLVDFLRDKKFAGGIRPMVSVTSYDIDGGQIDVIIVHNSDTTPFYLTENYQSVMPNNIYTRVMDSNTPKNKSADVSQIEILWKKRFGLLASPLERMKIYLRDANMWDNSPEYNSIEKFYYRFSPEFTIESIFDDSKGGYQYYLFNQSDIRPRWYDINLYYHQTMLISLEGLALDGGRYFTPSPITDGFSLTKYPGWDVSFKYFIRNSIEYIVHEFYYHADGDDQTIAHDRFMECILVFDSEDEKEDFKQYAFISWKNKSQYVQNIHFPYFEKIEEYNMNMFKEDYKNAMILKEMFREFHGSK